MTSSDLKSAMLGKRQLLGIVKVNTFANTFAMV